MRSYYRVMLGRGSRHAATCFKEGFIGADFDIAEDLSSKLPEQWREFNKRFIPVFLAKNPDKTKVGAGLACGALWRICKGFRKGDYALCPDGAGSYRVGEVTGDYYYAAGQVLPHRRKVRWFDGSIARTSMSEGLQNSSGSTGTVSEISSYAAEIERLLGEVPGPPAIVASDPTVEDPAAFAMEKHLEAFLVENWDKTVLSKQYTIFEEDGELVGRQYPTDVGPIDVLAISKNRKRLLVVELKRGRASDVVVGQILRYMGFIKEQVAKEDQTVEGAIIALRADSSIKFALSAVPSISFYRYEISFKLVNE